MAPVPNAQHAAGGPVARNHLALVSVVTACVFPAVLLLNIIARGFLVTGPLGGLLTPVAAIVTSHAYWLDLLGGVALFSAIVTGHLALSRSSRLPPQHARRGMALTGLVVGYLDLALFLLLAAATIWVYSHPIRLHIVF